MQGIFLGRVIRTKAIDNCLDTPISSSETLPRPTIVKHVLDNLDFKSPMCKDPTDRYGHSTDFKKAYKDLLATLSPTFSYSDAADFFPKD